MAAIKNTDAEIKTTATALDAPVSEKAAPETAVTEVKTEAPKKRTRKAAAPKADTAKPAKTAKTKSAKAAKAAKAEKPARKSRKTLSYEDIVAKAEKKATSANLARAKYPIAVNFELTGACDGVFYMLISQNEKGISEITVAPYKYDDYDVGIRADAEELAKIFDGRLNFYDALADDLHVYGNIKKAILFINAVL